MHPKCRPIEGRKVFMVEYFMNESPNRLAFLFLTIDNLNQYALWERFFSEADPRLYSIHVHPKYPDRVAQSLLFGRIARNVVETRWGHISQIRALNHLLKEALTKNETNAKFMYCSESSIPLYNFSSIYDEIMRDEKGFLHRYSSIQERWRRIKDKSYISKESFLKMCGEGWVFNRELAEHVVRNDHTDIFEKVACPLEHYYINLFQHLRLDIDGLLHNRRLTFFNWKECSPGGGHPKTYQEVTEQDVDKARELGFLFFRKVTAGAAVPVDHILGCKSVYKI